ncbi:MAG TPA: hypothetical protein VGL23_09290 [Chloroflexota bacterium]
MQPRRTTRQRPAGAKSLQTERVAALPERHVLSVIDPALTNSVMDYANGAQLTSTDPTTASNALPTQTIGAAVQNAQSSSAQQNGAVAQNVDSRNSGAFASVVRP